MDKLYLIFCIFGWGFSVFLNRLAVGKMHPIYIQLSASIIGLFLLPIYLLICSSNKQLGSFSYSGFGYASVAFLLSVFAALSMHSYIRSSNELSSAVALTSTYPIITILLSYLILNESFSNYKIIGILFILAGGVIVNL